MTITKTDFMTFRNCASDFWMKKHKPELFENIKPSDFEQQLIDQGYVVEMLAQKLFPLGIDAKNADAIDLSKLLQTPGSILFQPTFSAANLQARVDIQKVAEDGLHIYEVKGSTSKDKPKQDYIWDAGFQKEVIERAGHKVSKVFLIELNKEFIKDGPINPNDILTVTDVTQQIIDNHIEVKIEIANALNRLSDMTLPTSCDCYYKIRNNHCHSFTHFYTLPHYAVHDITRINKAKIAKFQAAGVESIDDITQYDLLTDIQLNQVTTHQKDHTIIRHQEIKDSLATLAYPLHFLDYETYPAAIPVFDGCFPYQQVSFQYSLHIQEEPGGPLLHREYLHLDATSPLKDLAASLRKDIGDKGSLIVWNQSFEGGRNKELAAANPEMEDFLFGLNDRFFDLMKIFSNQSYVHKAFKGKTSIKKVLPVLCPELSYAGLGIKEGGAASNAWRSMIFDAISLDQKELIAHDLLAYCKLDTYAMVAILSVLQKTVS
jgi:Domain of unknown function(DUF2779)